MTVPETEAAANRRWLIGIGITLIFGIFGAVMAWLSYANKTKAPAQQRATATVAPEEPAKHDHGKGKGHE